MLSYGRLTIDFGIVAFAKTRWLFSYDVKEHRNVLAGSRLQFWIKLANVNESGQMAVTTARFQRDDHVI